MDIKTKMVRVSDLSPRCLVRMLVRNLWLIAAGAAILAMAASLYLSWVLFLPQVLWGRKAPSPPAAM